MNKTLISASVMAFFCAVLAAIFLLAWFLPSMLDYNNFEEADGLCKVTNQYKYIETCSDQDWYVIIALKGCLRYSN